jgi:hypothetical protein
MKIIFSLCLALSLSGSAALFADQPAQPDPVQVQFEAHAVALSGLSPGGDVAIVSAAEEWNTYRFRYVRREALLTADRLGNARLSIPGTMPQRSTWAVVDVSTGRYTIASPTPATLQRMDLGPNALRKNGKGDLFKVDVPFGFADVLFVRPGLGSWVDTIGDGGPADDNAQPDGHVGARLDTTRTMGKKAVAAPGKLAKGDVVIVLDPLGMRYFATVIGGGE